MKVQIPTLFEAYPQEFAAALRGRQEVARLDLAVLCLDAVEAFMILAQDAEGLKTRAAVYSREASLHIAIGAHDATAYRTAQRPAKMARVCARQADAGGVWDDEWTMPAAWLE